MAHQSEPRTVGAREAFFSGVGASLINMVSGTRQSPTAVQPIVTGEPMRVESTRPTPRPATVFGIGAIVLIGVVVLLFALMRGR